jgi:hypothetical protein
VPAREEAHREEVLQQLPNVWPCELYGVKGYVVKAWGCAVGTHECIVNLVLTDVGPRCSRGWGVRIRYVKACVIGREVCISEYFDFFVKCRSSCFTSYA